MLASWSAVPPWTVMAWRSAPCCTRVLTTCTCPIEYRRVGGGCPRTALTEGVCVAGRPALTHLVINKSSVYFTVS